MPQVTCRQYPLIDLLSDGLVSAKIFRLSSWILYFTYYYYLQGNNLWQDSLLICKFGVQNLMSVLEFLVVRDIENKILEKDMN